jgi:hypothetical protein
MELKRGNLFAGAIVAISLGTFAVPFASASTGTGRTRPQANSFIQLAQEEHQELAQEEHQEVEEKSEHKVTETNDTTTAPGTTTVMPGNTTVVVPGNTTVAPAPETTERQSEHKSVDKEHEINALGIHAKSEHHVDESNSSADHD